MTQHTIDAGEIEIGADGSAVIPAEIVAAWGLHLGETVRVAVLYVEEREANLPLPGMELAGVIKTRHTVSLAGMERAIRRGRAVHRGSARVSSR